MKIYNGDTLVLDIAVDDDSYRYRAVMGENTLVLKFSLSQHVEIPTGSCCEFQGETYTLVKPENLKMNHTRSFDYTVEMHSSQSSLSKYKLRNTVDRRLKFSMTAQPREHLRMLVDNLNARESGWTVGECIESVEKLISYNHAYLHDALDQMAETFGTEWEVSGKSISLHKVEYNRNRPLALAYGKGKGFRPGIGRTNYEDSVPVEILYVQGGDRNIDASKYGSTELLLPKNQTIRYDGVYFEDEEGFDSAKARTYVTDSDGYSLRRQDKELKTQSEDSLDCSEIYPHRDEKILKFITVDTEKNWYDVVTDAPESLDYSKYGIGGETPTIIFQDGMLAGREFDLETDDDGNILCEKYYDGGAFVGWKFQIVPATLDGVDMPGGVYLPAVDDIFRVFGIQLPEAYIEDDATKSGASWEMFREGVKHLYDNEDAKFTFTGTLDGIWAKKDWLNIGGKIRLGGFISFTNEQFQPDPVLIRITGIKDYVNNPYSPEIELSNSTKGMSVSGELNKIGSNEEKTDNLFRDSVNFTKRRFRDTRETIAMLEEAMLTGFTDSISPLTVQTIMMLVGDQSLQFRFVDSVTDPRQVVHNVEYNQTTKILSIDGGIIQHMTLGINSVSTGHDAGEYKFWTLPEFSSPVLAESDKKYYVYAKVSATDGTGMFYMSETAKGMNSETGYYYLLMGLLNSEYDGERSYVSLYGYTEVLPGQITTDIIRDTGGNLIIDLVNRVITAKNGATIDGNITIGPNSSGLENLSEWPGKQQQISTAQDSANNAQATADAALQTAQDAKDYIDNTLPDEIADMNARIDGVVENWFYDYTPTRSNEPAMTWIANREEKKHVGDTFTNTQEYVDDATTPDAGKSWRWVASGSSYTWTPIADSDAVKALQQAAKAQDTADQKRRTFVTTPYTPYDVGDMWMQGPDGEIMRCIKARQGGSYTASDWDKASKYTDDTAALAAQAAADAASQAAQAAQSTANAAKTDAASANSALSNLMSDSLITPPEKTSLKQQHSDIKSEYSQIISDAQKYGVSTTAYTNAYNSANTALTKYTATSPENITVGSDYDNISAYYTARQTILNAIATAAKKVADDAQETADEALQNKTETTIDATSLDQDKYYPVTMKIDEQNRTYINVSIGLGQSGKPSWATHNNGFTCKARWSAYGNGWGNTAVSRIVDVFQWDFTEDNISPIGTVEQMTYSSDEYIYVRGGGKYIFTIWGGSSPVTPVLRTSTYSGSGGQTLAVPIDSVTVPKTTEQKISDLDYLKNTFGYVVDVNGVVLGKLVAVKDEDGNIKAMLNGSDLGKDASESLKGKLLFASGMNGTGHPESSKTRIYEGGLIESEAIRTKNGEFTDSKITGTQRSIFAKGETSISWDENVKIPEINDNITVSSSPKSTPYENKINPAGFVIGTENIDFLWDATQIGRRMIFVNHRTDDGYSSDCLQYEAPTGKYFYENGARNSKLLIYQNDLVELLGYGLDNTFYGWIVLNRRDLYNGYSCYCLSGTFAGLRPKVRTVGSNTELTEFDHTILIDASASIRINLPANPLIGQTYDLLMNNAPSVPFNHRIICNRNIIHYGQSDIWSASEVEIDAYGAVRMTFAEDINGNGRWWVYRIAV